MTASMRRRAPIASTEHSPCFKAFRLDRALPTSLRGPVERTHGLLASAALRSRFKPSGLCPFHCFRLARFARICRSFAMIGP